MCSGAKFKKITIFLLIFILTFLFAPMRIVNADDNEDFGDSINNMYTTSGKEGLEQIKESYKTNSDDINDLGGWLSERQSFIMIQKGSDDSGLLNNEVMHNYYWNVPNIQQLLYNTVSSSFPSGYGQGHGVLPYQKDLQLVTRDPNQAKTGMGKYGFDIPNPTYLGEKPTITMDLAKISVPKGFFKSLWQGIKYVFTGEIIPAPSDDIFESLEYMRLNDYQSTEKQISEWFKNNWNRFLDNSFVPEGQVLLSGTDDKGMDEEGIQWTKASVLEMIKAYSNREINDISPSEAQKILQGVADAKFNNIIRNMMRLTDPNKKLYIQRQMPYDYDQMSDGDKNAVGIRDPRAEYQDNVFDTGLMNYINLNGIGLKISGKIAEASVALNDASSMSFMRSAGLDPMQFWQSDIIRSFVWIVFIEFVVLLVKYAFDGVFGKQSKYVLIQRIFLGFFACIMLYTFSFQTDKFYNMTENYGTRIMDLGNIGLETEDTIKELYANGSAKDKENAKIWLLYYNNWVNYHTSRSLLDSKQRILPLEEDTHRERYKLEKPIIGDVEQGAWGTILADIFTKDDYYSNDIYRVVDHFMAPRVNVNLEQNDSGNDITNISVQQNENWNGGIQRAWNWMSLLSQLLVFCFVFLKFLGFIELMFNLIILFFRLAASVIQKNLIKESFFFIFGNIIYIMMLNLIITFVVYLTLKTTDPLILLVITSALSLFGWASLKRLIESNSIFRPMLLSQIINSIFIIFNRSKIIGGY